MDKEKRSKKVELISEKILDDLCSRFIINIPEQDRTDLIKVFFQIELAHWFYLDFYCTADNPELTPVGIREFSTQVFQHCPYLTEHLENFEQIISNWKQFKNQVPTYGAILLTADLTRCVLVQGYTSKSSWGFPRGKLNQGEKEVDCAIREVLEETGFDMSSFIDHKEYIEQKVHSQTSRLYIVHGVPDDTIFAPQTRKEIQKIKWFPVDALPSHRKDTTSKQTLGMDANSFFLAISFVKPLRKWINRNRASQKTPVPQQKGKSKSSKKERIFTDDWQQREFAQKNQAEYMDLFAKLRGESSSPKRPPVRRSPKRLNQTPTSNEWPSTSSTPVTILSRNQDEPLWTRSLTDVTVDTSRMHAGAWLNFKFDWKEVESCFS